MLFFSDCPAMQYLYTWSRIVISEFQIMEIWTYTEIESNDLHNMELLSKHITVKQIADTTRYWYWLKFK